MPPVPTPQVGTATAKAATFAVIGLDIDAGPFEAPAERRIVLPLRGPELGVLLGDQRVRDAVGHGRSVSGRLLSG